MPEPSARLRSLIEPLVEAQGLYLYDLEQTGGKLIVTVDCRHEAGDRLGGVDLAALTETTKVISRALDVEDPTSAAYLLEVTSPGLERRLRSQAQFAWAVGNEVTVRTLPEHDGDRRYTGVLVSVDDQAITIQPHQGEPVSLPYADIQKARTVVDFDAELRAAKHAPTSGKTIA